MECGNKIIKLLVMTIPQLLMHVLQSTAANCYQDQSIEDSIYLH